MKNTDDGKTNSSDAPVVKQSPPNEPSDQKPGKTPTGNNIDADPTPTKNPPETSLEKDQSDNSTVGIP